MCAAAQRLLGRKHIVAVQLLPGRTTETVECIADDLYADHLAQVDNGMVQRIDLHELT
jgi:hypothetical protein